MAISSNALRRRCAVLIGLKLLISYDAASYDATSEKVSSSPFIRVTALYMLLFLNSKWSLRNCNSDRAFEFLLKASARLI